MTVRCPLLGLFLCCAAACATGVPVSEEELAELQAQSPGGGGAPSPSALGGSGGSAVSPPSGLAGSSSSPPGGPGGSGGSTPAPTQLGGSGGSQAPSTGGPPVQINPGAGCGSTAPVATGGCAADTSITVLYTDRSDSPSFNQLMMTLSVENAGADFSASDLVLRYWFAADQGQTDFIAEIDYAQIGKENVCVSFGNQLGQNFADIGFSATQTIGEGIQDVQVRLHTQNYTQQDQSNDFSFISGANGVANANITVYRAGARVAGCEPE